jgi:Tol biopolymer transport system component
VRVVFRWVLAVVMAACGAGLTASAAGAAFPGRNGVIALALDNYDDGGNGDIVTVRPSGRGLERIYSEGYGGSGQLAPSYSPDGRRLVFETNGQGPVAIPPGDGALQVMNSDGSGLRSIPSRMDRNPEWGPNAHSLVSSDGESVSTQDLTSGVVTQIAAAGAVEPAWSIRNQIAFVRGGAIYVESAAGGAARRLADGRQPTFFPSGGKLAFVRNVARRGQVFVINADGTHLRQLTRSKRRSTSPAVSPDGKWIAFIHDDGRSENAPNTNHLWLMRADGTHVHQVPHLPGDDFGLLQAEHPNWQPLPG